ncbi:hypothetical protein B0H14DRAFT_2599953 [Mycena olivaceomarginata]|nr:hypothetical protein B0H14DRAFT_2599953 [Mycena olivaceomarginata]
MDKLNATCYCNIPVTLCWISESETRKHFGHCADRQPATTLPHWLKCGMRKLHSGSQALFHFTVPLTGGTLYSRRSLPLAQRLEYLAKDFGYYIGFGHCYLDLVEKNGVFMQATVDGGSETGELYAAHVALRQHCMPEISFEESAPLVAMKSTDNTPIESSWHLFTNYVGLDIKEVILIG